MSSNNKYVVWYREAGAWVEQGDGPLTLKTAERIVKELRRECGGSYKILPVGENPERVAVPASVALKIEVVPECDHGQVTGRDQYNAEAEWPANASWENPDEHAKVVRATLSVLGRGYNEAEAVADWTRRARADGHNVAGKLRKGGSS